MFLNHSCACLIIPSTIPDCDRGIQIGKLNSLLRQKNVFYMHTGGHL